jgi:alkylmercury lyase
MAAEIRPGVQRPDWSVVTQPATREALLGRNRSRVGPSEKWIAPLPSQRDLAWRAVLELFGKRGRPPHLADIANEMGLPLDELRPLVTGLQARDLPGMEDDAIIYAYPFTGQATEHRVVFHGHKLNARCAIDAWGVGGMYRTDVAGTSSCRLRGIVIDIGTARNGKVVSYARPVSAVVCYDLAYSQSAAISCCSSIAFLCGDDDLGKAGGFNRQQHSIGPVITGFQSFAPYGKLKFEVGCLFGLTTVTPRGAVRWQLEYEIVF